MHLARPRGPGNAQGVAAVGPTLTPPMRSYDEFKDRSRAKVDAAASDAALASRTARIALAISVVVTLLLYVVPLGGFVAYPLILVSTLVHELGHGLGAAALGGTFHEFEMFADASGVARWSGSLSQGARALVAAAGLLGPALGGAVGFVCARRSLPARVFLGVTALGLAVALALVVRNPFGIAFVGLCVAGLSFAVLYDRGSWAQLVLVFASTQLALSVFSRSDYLFVAEARTGAGVMPSDVSHMADALGGPYWLWGLIVGATSLLILAGGLYAFLRSPSSRAAPRSAS